MGVFAAYPAHPTIQIVSLWWENREIVQKTMPPVIKVISPRKQSDAPEGGTKIPSSSNNATHKTSNMRVHEGYQGVCASEGSVGCDSAVLKDGAQMAPLAACMKI